MRMFMLNCTEFYVISEYVSCLYTEKNLQFFVCLSQEMWKAKIKYFSHFFRFWIFRIMSCNFFFYFSNFYFKCRLFACNVPWNLSPTLSKGILSTWWKFSRIAFSWNFLWIFLNVFIGRRDFYASKFIIDGKKVRSWLHIKIWKLVTL